MTMHELLDAFDGWREANGALTDEEKAERREAEWNRFADQVREGING